VGRSYRVQECVNTFAELAEVPDPPWVSTWALFVWTVEDCRSSRGHAPL
jgi:hypothetical protein